jgi:hypothetical protein
MPDSLKRPVDPSAHPLVNQAYMVPTPAIAAMYSRVRQCIRRGVAGAVIYGHTRWGKTYAIRYCVRLLHLELPRVAVLTIGMPRNPSRSEALVRRCSADYASTISWPNWSNAPPAAN